MTCGSTTNTDFPLVRLHDYKLKRGNGLSSVYSAMRLQYVVMKSSAMAKDQFSMVSVAKVSQVANHSRRVPETTTAMSWWSVLNVVQIPQAETLHSSSISVRRFIRLVSWISPHKSVYRQ